MNIVEYIKVKKCMWTATRYFMNSLEKLINI